ncbi:hypothetical protein HMPREF1548_05931 [Clostridium sp. KLE 1755]|nr:hypothetical protein HMPREF1548_05931 [Clostridium sp. KLE 1755]
MLFVVTYVTIRKKEKTVSEKAPCSYDRCSCSDRAALLLEKIYEKNL